MRQVGDDVLGQPVRYAFPFRVTAEIVERQHGKRRSVTADEARLLQPSGDTEGSNRGNDSDKHRCGGGADPAMSGQPANRRDARFRKTVDLYPVENDRLADILDVL